jgi:triphosphatase
MAEQSALTLASETQIQPIAASFVAALAGTGCAWPFHAQAIALHPQTTAAQAFTAITTACLRQIVLNEPGVRAGSGEAVHQMRVGLRRLRAAISLFASVLRPGEFDGLKAELVWLTEQLGPAREFDVLGESVRTHAVVARGTLGTEGVLDDELNRRRQAAFAVAGRAVQSARFQRLIVSAAVGLISRVDTEGKGEREIRKLAREILEHRTRRARRRLARFSQLGVGERHKLRIYLKKLRYGAEFFAAVFPKGGHSQQRFIRRLEALQDTLGKLNDHVMHQRIARELIADDRNDDQAGLRIAFAIGAFSASEQAELKPLLKSVVQQRKSFERAPRFWR